MDRYLLIVFFIFYFTTAFILPSYRVWKATGIVPITFRGADNAHDYIGKIFKFVMLGLAIVITVNAIVPGADQFLLRLSWLDHPYVQLTGFVVLLFSLLWTITAQLQMGNSWRIGIDSKTPTILVSTGLFGVSRNPIFLGMILTLIGIVLALPNAFTLLVLVLGFVLIQIQVRLEEEFLKTAHGEHYEEYMKNTRRWF